MSTDTVFMNSFFIRLIAQADEYVSLLHFIHSARIHGICISVLFVHHFYLIRMPLFLMTKAFGYANPSFSISFYHFRNDNSFILHDNKWHNHGNQYVVMRYMAPKPDLCAKKKQQQQHLGSYRALVPHQYPMLQIIFMTICVALKCIRYLYSALSFISFQLFFRRLWNYWENNASKTQTNELLIQLLSIFWLQYGLLPSEQWTFEYFLFRLGHLHFIRHRSLLP